MPKRWFVVISGAEMMVFGDHRCRHGDFLVIIGAATVFVWCMAVPEQWFMSAVPKQRFLVVPGTETVILLVIHSAERVVLVNSAAETLVSGDVRWRNVVVW